VVIAGAAVITLLLGLVALRLVGWPIASDQAPPYRGETWFVAALMATAAGVALVVRSWARLALAVASASALQLVGTGIVARRRWLTSVGFGSGYPADNLAELRTVAILLSVVAAIATLGALTALWLTRDCGRVAWWRIAVGGALAVLAPLSMGWEAASRTTQLGAHGLMYGAWGVGIALAALLAPNHRRAVDLALVACGIATLLSGPMIPAPRTWLGVAVLVIAVAVVELGDQRERVASNNSSAVSGVAGVNA
jgi:hypothetical protein